MAPKSREASAFVDVLRGATSTMTFVIWYVPPVPIMAMPVRRELRLNDGFVIYLILLFYITIYKAINKLYYSQSLHSKVFVLHSHINDIFVNSPLFGY